jgi:hypothetical protein
LTSSSNIKSVQAGARVYDWCMTLQTVKRHLSIDSFFPTFHDDVNTHRWLYKMATIHHTIQFRYIERDRRPTDRLHGEDPQLSLHSWKDLSETPNPPYLEGSQLLQDGWIRKCKGHKKLGGYTYYEFLLPAFGKEATANGARFDIYGEYSSLQKACLTREWPTMVLFKKDSFPILVTLPRGEIIAAPSLLSIDSQRRMRLVYKTFILSTETPFFEDVLTPSGMEISNKNVRAAFTNASRLQGILVPYEAMRRLATIGAFLQRF